MKKLITILLFVSSLAFGQISWSYGWEDGATALATNGNAIISNSTEQAHSGTRSLKFVEDPLSGTPEAYIWWVTGLTDGDEITASFWVYDVSPSANPSGRIWGNFTSDPNDVASYSGSASGNLTYSDGTGWSQLSYTWTFVSSGDDDGLVVQARIYSGTSANIIYIDDAEIIVSNESAIIHAANNGVLPVELTTFSANVIEKNVNLNWETATEVNNYGFDIERKNESEEWNKLGFVNGHGNSNSPKYYSYTDNTVNSSGKYFYRLKQVDIDGTYEYSNVVEVILDTPKDFELTQNYPNPFNPSTSIQFNLPLDSHVKLSVYNVLGEEVKQLLNENYSAGFHNIKFNGSEFNSGIYFYKLEAGNFVQIRKMILVK